MNDCPVTRRNFIRVVGLGATAAALGIPASSTGRIRGANERVRVGIVGFSDRARYSLIPAFLRHAPELDFDIVAVSDIWRLRRQEGEAFLTEKTGHRVSAFRNNEEMYQSGQVDAVIISTADFQHAVHAVEAMESGCDVYVEKPFANSLADARAALQTVTKSGKILQVGTQRRSARNYRLARDFVRSSRFGEIIAVEMTWNVNQPGRWRRPELVAMARQEDVDWRRFLINRPFEPWDARKFVEYRLFWPYSSGIPCQWMVHQIDVVNYFTGLPRPRSVVASGGIYFWRDGRKNFDTFAAVFDYGPLDEKTKGFQVNYSSRMANSAGGVKEIYFSNGGALNLDTNTVTPDGGLTVEEAEVMGLSENRLPRQNLMAEGGVASEAVTGEDEATSAHMRNWMECVRSRKPPNAGIQAAYDHSVTLCMTIAAMQSGKRVTFDDARREIVIG